MLREAPRIRRFLSSAAVGVIGLGRVLNHPARRAALPAVDGSCHGRAGSGGVAKSLQAGCRAQARNRHARGSKIRLDGSGSSVASAGVDVQAPVIGIIGAGSDAPGSVPRIRKSGIRVRGKKLGSRRKKPGNGKPDMKLPINLGSVPDMNLPDPGGGQGKPQQNQLVSALGFCQLVVNRKNGALQGKGVKGLLAQPLEKVPEWFLQEGR